MFVLSIVSVIIFFHFTTLGTSVFFVRESSRSQKHRFSPTIKLPDKSRKRLCIQRFSQRKGLENGCIAIHCKLLFVFRAIVRECISHTIQLRLRQRLVGHPPSYQPALKIIPLIFSHPSIFLIRSRISFLRNVNS